MKKNVTIFAISFLFFTSAVLGQNQSDCVQLLKDEYKNVYKITSEAEIYNHLTQLFELEETKLDEFADSYESGDEIDGAYKAISVYWSKNRKKESFRRQFSEYKERYKLGFTVDNKFYDTYYSSTVNESAYQKFIDCKNIEANLEIEKERLKVYNGGIYFKTVGDFTYGFTFVLNKKPAQGQSEKVKIVNIVPNNLDFEGTYNLKPGSLLENYTGISQNMKFKNPTLAASLTINLENYDPIVVEFPSTASPDYPLGTIIISVLDFNAFSSEANSKMPFDENKSKWAPADGRNVRYSEYGKKYNELLPDLRGQFLRGNNQMYSPGEPNTYANGNDIGERTSNSKYSYQVEATKLPKTNFEIINSGAHTHIFKGQTERLSGDGGAADDIDRGNGNYAPAHSWTPKGEVTAENSTHNHTVNGGGDKETRPKNIAVFYYIRINK